MTALDRTDRTRGTPRRRPTCNHHERPSGRLSATSARGPVGGGGADRPRRAALRRRRLRRDHRARPARRRVRGRRGGLRLPAGRRPGRRGRARRSVRPRHPGQRPDRSAGRPHRPLAGRADERRRPGGRRTAGGAAAAHPHHRHDRARRRASGTTGPGCSGRSARVEPGAAAALAARLRPAPVRRAADRPPDARGRRDAGRPRRRAGRKSGLAAMRAHGVTHASATPTYWRFLLAELRRGQRAGPGARAGHARRRGGAGPPARRAAPRLPGRAHLADLRGERVRVSVRSVRDGRNGLPLSASRARRRTPTSR